MNRRIRPVLLLGLLLPMLGWALGVGRAAVEESVEPPQRNRLAIVIGNSAYQSSRIEKLPNASNDASRLAESLKRLNFEVLLGTDLTREGFEELFSRAEARLPSLSAVMVFYAGHGVQLQGQNYLLPIDTPDPESVEKLIERAVQLNEVIKRFSSPGRQTFFFLDSCRNNPVPDAPNAANGLAQVEVGENAFIAFATQPGNVTVDGSGSNSPFTTALLEYIEIPGLSISDMMIAVRNRTRSLTFDRQDPWDQSSLREQFYFTEQQTLDPIQLASTLNSIMADPEAKRKLDEELHSLKDLQTAVLVVQQKFRGLNMEPGAPGAAPPKSAEGTQVASLETARETVVSGIEALIIGRANDPQADKAVELARSVQTELRRLGCYRLPVDGEWGKGSVRALTEYYRNTKQPVTTTEPTAELLGDLFLRSGRICKEPVVVPKTKVASGQPKQPTKGATSSSGAAKGRKTGGGAAARPAPPPPDISGGIGIGGVF